MATNETSVLYASNAVVEIRPPTFDEWFMIRNSGRSFDEMHCAPGMRIDTSLRVLSQLMRDYVTELARHR